MSTMEMQAEQSTNVELRDNVEVQVISPPKRSSYLQAESGMPSTVIFPDTYFLSKFPIEHLMEEFASFAKSKEDDSKFIHLWILKQIDHWNNDHEMVLALSNNGLYSMKFDFVTRKLRGEIQMVPLANITSLLHGNITYPQYSVMDRLDVEAIRVAWGDLNNASFTQRWNPNCRTLPYAIYASHPLHLANPSECDAASRDRFDVAHFTRTLTQAVQAHTSSLQCEEGPILISSYLSFSSLVFNQSQLGFSKDRNGVSF